MKYAKFRIFLAGFAALALSCSQVPQVSAQINNPGQPGTVSAGTGLSGAGSVLSVVYGTSVNTSLMGNGLHAPTAIGDTTPNSGAFTTLSASGTVSGAGFSNYLSTGLSSPTAIGNTAPSTGAFTTLSASSTVSGSGFSTYLASPPAIGGTAPSTGAFTNLSSSGTVSGTGFSSYLSTALSSPTAIGNTTPSTGAFTTLSASTSATAPTAQPLTNSTVIATTAYTQKTAPVVGEVRNFSLQMPSAASTMPYTADEIVVETALGGASYKIASVSHTLNLATTGANGMDTGTVPANGWICIYEIFNPSTVTAASLAYNSTGTAGTCPSIYPGANMPGGYTASALVSIWQTSSSLGSVGMQSGRHIDTANINIASTTSQPTSITSISFSACAPTSAKYVNGALTMYPSTTGTYFISMVNLNNNIGVSLFSGYGTSGNSLGGNFKVYVSGAASAAWVASTLAGTYNVNCTGYDF
jgi:hypothetical protein